MADERKLAYIREVVRGIQSIIPFLDDLANLENEYFDNGYDGAGADPIVDANLTIHNLTATEFGNGITLMQQLEKFRTNQAVTTGDYALTINDFRRAPGV